MSSLQMIFGAAMTLLIAAAPIAGGRAAESEAKAEAEADFAGSLLFSISEQQSIEAALSIRPRDRNNTPGAGKDGALQIPENKPSWKIERLHLSALIYTDASNWTLWLGNRQVRMNSIPPFLQQLKVTAHHADMTVIPTPGASPIAVRLRPNQTFLIDQLRITDDSRTRK